MNERAVRPEPMLDMRSAGSLMPARIFVTVAAIAHFVSAAVLLFVPATLGLAALPVRAVAAWRRVALVAHALAGALALVRPAGL